MEKSAKVRNSSTVKEASPTSELDGDVTGIRSRGKRLRHWFSEEASPALEVRKSF
ncbi:hypothetical protein TIFTF001_021426 [Ficus carica]|uniref:Uncharacterized protein n=1 Tax=Ficus carica TaxID=3494 RepID=A0AA88AYT7_FICCA|nr:hypothetical protein TIFTF001_021426 [Ficus carica]